MQIEVWKLVEKLYKNNGITSREADSSKTEFSNFLALAQQHREKFSKHTQILDSFLSEFIVPRLGQYKHKWKICVFIFTLCHGQCQVERGFNINKNTLQENLQKKSLVGRRTVYDTLVDSRKSSHDFVIINKLILSCKSVSSKIPSIIMNWPKRKRIPLPPKMMKQGKQFLSKWQNLNTERCH